VLVPKNEEAMLPPLPPNERVLVAIMNNPLDFAVARDQHWYRIPVTSATKWLKGHWPPQWLAFYQTKVFGSEAFAIHHYCQILDHREVYRWQLFPDQPRDEKARQRYYQLFLGPLQRLAPAIVSRRRRRIVFIPTTWQRFVGAVEINDLYHESPLEDLLWQELKRLRIPAERQEFLAIKDRNYALDFAVYCAAGKLDIETDGDTWHGDPQRIPLDNLRDNDLETAGWKLLRFNTTHVREQLADYCLPTIVENINRLGGVEEGQIAGRRVALDPDTPTQPPLFDD
jgi:very-short-patch-repair endonuclease